MKPQILTEAILLTRTDFAEADRIVTFLTPGHGKVTVLAKGVRKVRSKLAGGIELFSESQISFIYGRGEVGTLISSRLIRHYGEIVKNVERTMLGYELLKRLHRATEDAAGEEYYRLLQDVLASLNDSKTPLTVLELWFNLQLIKIAGHSPNLRTDSKGKQLEPDRQYGFDVESMTFTTSPRGKYSANHIKVLRVCISAEKSEKMVKITGIEAVARECVVLSRQMLQHHVRT